MPLAAAVDRSRPAAYPPSFLGNRSQPVHGEPVCPGRPFRASESAGRTPFSRKSAISQHSKNLLEAFKSSQAPAKAPEPQTPTPVPARKEAPSAPSPAAPPARAQSAAPAPMSAPASSLGAPKPPPGLRTRDARPGFTLPPPAVLALIGVLLLACVFSVGRWSASWGANEVEARQPPQQAAPQTPPATAPAQAEGNSPAPTRAAPPPNATAADRALFDPGNKWTVQAIEYKESTRFRELAGKVYAALLAQNLPVCQPYSNGSSIYVVVGAAPNSADLERLLAQVRAATAQDGRKGEFSTAYLRPIDKLIPR